VYALVLCVISSASFVHVMRYAQLRRLNIAWVGAVNYVLATAFCGAWWATETEHAPVAPALVMGAVTGALFAALYFLLAASFNHIGSGLTQCVSRVSVVLPIIVSAAVYDPEPPGGLRVLGIALALASLPLLTLSRSLPHARASRWRIPVAAALFIANGLAGVFFKAYVAAVPEGGMAAFLTCVFAVATVALMAAATRGGRPRLAELIHGASLGMTNVGANAARLWGLAAMAGSRFFPTESAGTIVLTVLLAAVLWKERFGYKAIVGIAMAVPAIVLVQL